MLPNKPLPNSVESEQALLGSLLLEGSAFSEIESIVSAQDFYDSDNSKVFLSMSDLYERRSPIDLVTVRNRLLEKNDLNGRISNVYLVSLTNTVFTSSHVIEYAQNVKKSAILRKLISVGNEIMLSGYDESSEVSDLVTSAEKKISMVPMAKKDSSVTMDEFYESYCDRVNKLNEGGILGYRTGIPVMDKYCDGLQPGTVTRLNAYPNTGKTRIAVYVMCNLLRSGIRCAFYSLEVTKEMFFPVFASIFFQESFDEIKFGRKQINWDILNSLPFRFYQGTNDLSDIISSAKFHKEQVVFIDYAQLVKAMPNPKNHTENMEEYAHRIQQFAIENNVAVFDLSQINMEGAKQDGKGILLPSKGSGALVEAADVGILLTRRVYDEKSAVLEFNIKKNKYGPPVCRDIAVDFANSKFTQMEDFSRKS